MAEQTFANGPRIDIRTNARGGVVVEFEKDHAEIVNQPVDGTSDVLACGRRAEIEQIAARIADAHAVALEERVIGQALGERRFHTDHLRLEPQSQAHAMRADGVGQTLESSFAETVRGGLPFADHVPPAAVRAVVPAGVDAENVRADACRALDERQLLLQARVAEQGVHVIVVDDESLRAFELLGTTQFASLGGTQRTALQCHFGDGLLPVAGRDGERNGHRFGIVAFAQLRIPLMVLEFRAERADMQAGIVLADFPLPWAVVFDLPHDGEVAGAAGRAFHLYDAGRFVHAGAPRGG